jgi:peptidoglycan/LPS O-acetylase OafA/YrhL
MSVLAGDPPATRPPPAAPDGPAPSTRLRPPEGSPKRARSREMEGYRGLAAVSIVTFHVCQYALPQESPNPLFVAITRFEVVDVLFAMSAYLLTLSYARSALDGGDHHTAGEFLFRRAVRILPLYWIAVIVVWAIRNPTMNADWIDLIEHLTFTHVFDQKRIFYTLGPVWSMSLEIIFYGVLVILGPLAVRLCRRLATRRQRVTVLLAGCAVLYAIPVVWNSVAFLVFNVPYERWPVYFGPQARFGAFAVGMALAVIVAARRSKPVFAGVWPTVLRVTGLLIVLGATALNQSHTWGQATYHDVSALGWALLLASTVLGVKGQAWSRWLSWRPLTWVGLLSYSIYMWHEPLMMWLANVGLISRSPAALPAAIAVMLVAATLVGALSYHLIEYPTSKLRAVRRKDGRPRDYYPDLPSPEKPPTEKRPTEKRPTEERPTAKR